MNGDPTTSGVLTNYNTGQPYTGVYGPQVAGASTSNPDVGWNTAWNQGYNNSTGTMPYSGYTLQGFQAGQAQYKTDYTNSHPSGGSVPQPGPAPTTPQAPSGDGSSAPNP